MPCMCGDSECPSCGLAQGTLADDLDIIDEANDEPYACDMCDKYEAMLAEEQATIREIEPAVLRAVETAYRLGAKDAKRLVVGEVQRRMFEALSSGVGPSFDESNAQAQRMVQYVILEAERVDVERARPDLTGIVRIALGGGEETDQ